MADALEGLPGTTVQAPQMTATPAPTPAAQQAAPAAQVRQPSPAPQPVAQAPAPAPRPVAQAPAPQQQNLPVQVTVTPAQPVVDMHAEIHPIIQNRRGWFETVRDTTITCAAAAIIAEAVIVTVKTLRG